MEHKIIEKPAFNVIGKPIKVSLKDQGYQKQIMQLWQEFMTRVNEIQIPIKRKEKKPFAESPGVYPKIIPTRRLTAIKIAYNTILGILVRTTITKLKSMIS